MTTPYANLQPNDQVKLQTAIAQVRSAIRAHVAAVHAMARAHDAVDAVVPIGSQLDGNETISTDRTIQSASMLASDYNWNTLVNCYNQLAAVVAEDTTARKNYWVAAIGPENMP
jgi:hypothetical protein